MNSEQGKESRDRVRNRAGMIAVLGVCTGAAMILSYIESLIPMPFAVPGMKLGLPNLAVVVLMYYMGSREAIAVNMMRICLTGFLFGSMFGIMYAMSGAVVSFIAMYLCMKSGHLTIRGVSMAGGVSHNIGQMAAALFLMKTPGVIWYLPPLLIAGLVTGFITGVISNVIIKSLTRGSR